MNCLDTGYDFIQPEFLNILVFQQKNLVVFPYVDLKQLRSLEIFALGYNVINLESTAITNLKDILEYEANNSYSQSKNLYFIYNLDREKIKHIIGIENFRCILNTKENVSDLADGDNYVFFNKKINKFLNYDISDANLEFEKYLINNSKNESVLLDYLQTLNSKALRIFNDLNLNGNLNNLSYILKDYDKKFWLKILNFVELLYQIKIPKDLLSNCSQNETDIDFSNEYELIMNSNDSLAKSFIQNLHQFAQTLQEINSTNSHFLFYPQELYNYLRNHQWKEKISKSFVVKWLDLKNSRHKSIDKDWEDINYIANKSDFFRNSFSDILNMNLQGIENKSKIVKKKENGSNSKSLFSSVDVKNFEEFKKNIFKKLDAIDKFISIK